MKSHDLPLGLLSDSTLNTVSELINSPLLCCPIPQIRPDNFYHRTRLPQSVQYAPFQPLRQPLASGSWLTQR
ncbi:MAG TPA: hypothetical protein VKT82_12085 [Ktedonobacterales bacterium]|nr:hypothetical protein [Ktedonobacterales bacterium]